MGQDTTEHTDLINSSCPCFSENRTPEYIKARFEGLDKCEDVAPGTPGGPLNPIVMHIAEPRICRWIGEDGDWVAEYTMHSMGHSYLTLLYQEERSFSGERDSTCNTNFFNNLDCDFLDIIHEHGHGCVMWVPDTGCASIHHLLTALGMSPSKDILYEFWPAPDELTVIKLCNKKESTRVHIKFAPDPWQWILEHWDYWEKLFS